MATSDTLVRKQLATDTQNQTNATTPQNPNVLPKNALARYLWGSIRRHHKDHFYKFLELGPDLNFMGPDDRGEHINPLIYATIQYSNTWAFDELLKRGADVNKLGLDTNTPLFIAAATGNNYMARQLLAKGADPLDFCGGTCLPLILEYVVSNSLLDARWLYEGEPPSSNNPALKRDITHYFNQEGAYTPPKSDQGTSFIPTSKVIHVYYQGNLDMLGLFLSRHVSPTIPVSGTNRSPLELLRNPQKFISFFRSGTEEEMQYIGTEGENGKTLVFKFKFWNKKYLGTGPVDITLHYDLEPAYKLIEGAVAHLGADMHAVTKSLTNKMDSEVRDMRETGANLSTQLSSVQDRLVAVQDTLTIVDTKTKMLMQPKEQRVEWANWIALPGHENLAMFYHTLVTKIQNTIISFKAVDGGQIEPKPGKLAAINGVIGTLAEVVSIAPLVGKVGEKFIKWGLQAGLDKIDKTRELNAAKQVGKITWREVEKDGPILARMLTVAFAQQLLALPTPEEAEKKARLNPVKKGVNKLNALVLKSQFISPAEIEAMVAMTWFVELLYDTPDIALQAQQKGFANVFFSAIVGRESPSKVMEFWQSVTKNLDGISTKSGATWHPEDMFVLSGIRTENGKLYVHAKSKPEIVGWRLATVQDANALNLTETNTPTNLPPDYLLSLKIPQSLCARSLPFNPSQAETSLDLPLPNGNTSAVTFAYGQHGQSVPFEEKSSPTSTKLKIGNGQRE